MALLSDVSKNMITIDWGNQTPNPKDHSKITWNGEPVQKQDIQLIDVIVFCVGRTQLSIMNYRLHSLIDRNIIMYSDDLEAYLNQVHETDFKRYKPFLDDLTEFKPLENKHKITILGYEYETRPAIPNTIAFLSLLKSERGISFYDWIVRSTKMIPMANAYIKNIQWEYLL